MHLSWFQIQEPVLYATLVPVIELVALVAEWAGESVLVIPWEGRGLQPVWRRQPTPSLLYLRLMTLHPLSVWLSGWSGSGVAVGDSIHHRYVCENY